MLAHIQDFEAGVLEGTHATRIRLETPTLTAWTFDDPEAADELKEEGYSAPGYVAFMAAPDAMSEGVYHTMHDIARLYFDQFPEAPACDRFVDCRRRRKGSRNICQRGGRGRQRGLGGKIDHDLIFENRSCLRVR